MEDNIEARVALKALLRHLIGYAGASLVTIGATSPESFSVFASGAADILAGLTLTGASYGLSLLEKKKVAVAVARAIETSASTGVPTAPKVK